MTWQFPFTLDELKYGTEPGKGAPPAQTYMDEGVHTVLDPLVGIYDPEARASDEMVGYAKGFMKAVPLFMKGRGTLTALAASYAVDEAKRSDPVETQIFDAGLGAGKAVLMKKSMDYCQWRGFTPGTTGMSLGILNRGVSVGLTRESYFDRNGDVAIDIGLKRTALAAFNPASLGVDLASYGAADIIWGRIASRTRGKAVFNPILGSGLTAGTMGATSGFGNELQRQLTVDDSLDPLKLVRHTVFQGSVDALAGGIGGLQARRYMRLPETDGPNAIAEARATPFQLGTTVDVHQAKLRDGTFVLGTKVSGLTTETWFGSVQHGGETIPVVFRPSNGSEQHAHRQQAEIAAYGLKSVLGFDNNMPVTVARTIERNGTQYSGFIQEMRGKNLADLMLSADGQVQAPSAIVAQFRNDQRLQEGFARNFVHRMILGEWDNHAKNMGLNTHYDLQDALPQARSMLDLVPRPGLRYGWESTNYHLYNQISGKAIPKNLQIELADLHQRFNNPDGRLQMQSVGLTGQMVDGVLGKTSWFSTNGIFPRQQENYFYREHFGKTIKPILKRLLRGSPAQAEVVQENAGF